MKTNLFFVLAICPLYFTVFGTNPIRNEGALHKNAYDTLVIQEISKELYVCTCKPNTSNPAGEGQIYFQGKYKEAKVTKDVNYEDCDERFLILWNLAKLPDGIEIVEAKMVLYCMKFIGDKHGQLIYESISEPWNADVGFAKKPNTSDKFRILTGWPESQKYHVVNVTGLIKNWYSKEVPNYGIMGYSINTENTNSAMFCTSIFPDKAARPKLVIIYQKNKS